MTPVTLTIGIFDSGIGGLAIAHEIKRQLPNSPIVYFADSAYNPYGELSESQLITRCISVVTTLIEEGCELIVVACNTATVNCIKILRERFAVQFVGVEPGLKPAVAAAEKPLISVMATSRTINSVHYQNVKTGFLSHSNIQDIPCIGLADYVESLNGTAYFDATILAPFVSKIITHNASFVVLGCTHYSLIKREIVSAFATRQFSTELIDTSVAVATQVHRLIIGDANNSSLPNCLSDVAQPSIMCKEDANLRAQDVFITSGELSKFEQQLLLWWPARDDNNRHCVRVICHPKSRNINQ